jgi:exopolysaccharide biosynthesis polyprenyl glycosylphosphotransferase
MRSMPASVFLVLAVVSVTSASVHHGVRAFLDTRERERILILGTGPLALKVSQALHARAPIRPFSVRFLHEEQPVSGPLASLAHGSIGDLAESFKTYAPRRIVAALSEGSNHFPTRELLAFRARGGIVESGIQAYERITGKLAIESVTPRDIVFSEAFRLSPWQLWLKRLSSIIVALIGLLLTAPLFPFIALAIRLTSRGPIFFAQERVGLHGQPFRLYKFRTMEITDGPHSEWERDNADRITPLGHWLRKLRFDELPQFWNILRGDMNIVGPRPHPVSNYELFADAIPYYSLRSLIPPGLTGWAQIRRGYVHDLPGEVEKMRYDLYYIAHLSLWLDLKILFETARVVIFQALEDDLPPPSAEETNKVSAESGHEDADREWQEG